MRGVEVDLGEGGENVRGIEDAGIEAALPKPAASIEPTVEILAYWAVRCCMNRL